MRKFLGFILNGQRTEQAYRARQRLVVATGVSS
jgi:hypothetical protein